jgi:hypothetical protein
MPKTSGLGDNLLVAQYNLSGDVGSLGKIGGGNSPLDVTSIQSSGSERIGGKRDGSIEFNTWFNPDPSREHVALKALPTADVVVSYLRGTALGAESCSCTGKQLNYDGKRGSDGAFALDVVVASDAFGIEWGRTLTAGVRSDTAATNGTGRDDVVVSTAFGLQAYLHLLTFTGTSVTVTIEDSADNVSFATVAGATFGALSAPGAARIAVAGTVRRYLRAVTTGTFSQASFAVTVVRNETIVVF